VTAYVHNTVYSELMACNPTLTRWLHHRYKKAAYASRNSDHVRHSHTGL